MKPRKKRKLRKPRLKGWECVADFSLLGGGVLHKSGRFWTGIKRLEAMGKFFLKAAAWLKQEEEK